jgi:hypothetical protein
MHCTLPPSEPQDGERSRCFRLAAVGGAQLRGDWHLSAIARLQGFSSGSPAASPHQWSRRWVTTGSMVGRSKLGCGLYPALTFKDLHHPCWGGGRAEGLPSRGLASRFFLRHLGVETILQLCGGGVLQPCGGKANCCCPARVQHSVLYPGDCGRPHRRVSQHVVRRKGGTRVLGRSRSRFRGEDGGEDLPVRFGRPALAGAVLVGRWTPPSVLRWWQPEKVSPPTRSSAPSALRASVSLALISGSRPLRGDANESLPVVAFTLGPSLLLQRSLASHPEFVVP